MSDQDETLDADVVRAITLRNLHSEDPGIKATARSIFLEARRRTIDAMRAENPGVTNRELRLVILIKDAAEGVPADVTMDSLALLKGAPRGRSAGAQP